MKPSPAPPDVEEQAALWAARLDGSVLSADDRTALDTWLAGDPLHRTLLSHYCQFSADLEQQLPLIEGIKDQSAETLTSLKTAQPFPWLRRPLMAGVTLFAAAAVAVVFWLNRPESEHANIATPVAERQTLTLADGSRLELNAQTSVQIEIDGRDRRVRLASGEAFFSVHKDATRPFFVETPAGSVRVTGTQFDVRADSGAGLEVTVAEGTVQVHPADVGDISTPPVVLTSGDQLGVTAGKITVRALTIPALEDALAWRQGQIVFTGTPLREALARFARYHGRGITATAGAEDLRVGGRFSLDDLDGFFAALEEVLPVKVSRNLNGTVQVGLRPAH